MPALPACPPARRWTTTATSAATGSSISWERLSDGSLVATNADSIFYTFQGKLMKTQRMSQPDFFLATFRTTTDSLVMLNIYASPYDSLVAPSALSAYGVSPSGRFHFDHLSSSRLVLSTETSRLTFRKY